MSSSASRPHTVWSGCGAGYVAVYGTLRAGGSNDIAGFAPGIRCLGQTWLRGQLFDMGDWPGLRPGAGPVLAEIYPLEPQLEQRLDQLEDLWPVDLGQYRKVQIQLELNGQSGPLHTLIYMAEPAAIAGCPALPDSAGGDWLAWMQAGKPG